MRYIFLVLFAISFGSCSHPPELELKRAIAPVNETTYEGDVKIFYVPKAQEFYLETNLDGGNDVQFFPEVELLSVVQSLGIWDFTIRYHHTAAIPDFEHFVNVASGNIGYTCFFDYNGCETIGEDDRFLNSSSPDYLDLIIRFEQEGIDCLVEHAPNGFNIPSLWWLD